MDKDDKTELNDEDLKKLIVTKQKQIFHLATKQNKDKEQTKTIPTYTFYSTWENITAK